MGDFCRGGGFYTPPLPGQVGFKKAIEVSPLDTWSLPLKYHIYQCEQIWKLRNESNMEVPKYEYILYGDVKQKVKVARLFPRKHENTGTKNIFKKKYKNIYLVKTFSLEDQVTDWKILSAVLYI